MIEFREVAADNFEDIISLHKKPEQKDFVMGNLYSIAQSKVMPSLIPLGIYSDGTAIGFVLYEKRNKPDNHIFLKRYMIDARYQGKGLGKKSLVAFINYIGDSFPGLPIELMHYPDNVAAGKLYDSIGFLPTGETRDNEIVKRLFSHTHD